VIVARNFAVLYDKRLSLTIQATLTTVQEAGLLVLVLNHLESLEDIFCSSAVNKRWHCACQQIQPASLTLPGRHSHMDEDGMMSVRRWELCR